VTLREQLREQLARDEGLKLTAYQDALGVWTLGYGHNLANPIPRAAAALILEADLDDALQQVRDRLSWSIDVPEARRAVLVNMAFNLGMAGLLGFRKFLVAAQAGDWGTAAREMLDSRWATQVGDRARRLADQMRDGVWR